MALPALIIAVKRCWPSTSVPSPLNLTDSPFNSHWSAMIAAAKVAACRCESGRLQVLCLSHSVAFSGVITSTRISTDMVSPPRVMQGPVWPLLVFLAQAIVLVNDLVLGHVAVRADRDSCVLKAGRFLVVPCKEGIEDGRHNDVATLWHCVLPFLG